MNISNAAYLRYYQINSHKLCYAAYAIFLICLSASTYYSTTITTISKSHQFCALFLPTVERREGGSDNGQCTKHLIQEAKA